MINDETLVALAEENDELRARAFVYRDAIDHAYAIAKKALLPDPDMPELMAKVREVLTQARTLCDSLNGATQRRGMEIVDNEILALATAAGGHHFLTGEGQLRWIAARKRASQREAKSLAEHGRDLLKLAAQETPIRLALVLAEDAADDAALAAHTPEHAP